MRTGKRCHESLLCPMPGIGVDAHHSSSRRVERHSVHLQPRDERSRLDSRPPHFSGRRSVLAKGIETTNVRRKSACGLYIRTIRSTPVRGLRKGTQLFAPLLKASIWWASLYSRALTTICVDEVPAPRSRPTTVRQGNGGAITGPILEYSTVGRI